MIRREPQLVFFTIFSQMSTGLVVVWGLAAIFTGSPDLFLSERLPQLVLGVALLVLVLGVVAASLHLGNPGRSLLTLTNLKHSWLSREALVGLVFGGLVMTLLAISWAGTYPGLPWSLVIVSSLVGLSLVWGIARLYMLRTVPAWNHLGTPATFLTTSLLLGTAAFQIIYTRFCGHLDWSRYFDLALLGLVSLQSLIWFSNLVFLSTRGEKGVESLQIVWSVLRPLMIIRWVLSFGSLGLLFSRSSDGSLLGINPFGAVFLVFALLLGSEIIGRWIFYGSYWREGI
jgi:anaerobic dimethyl sulfoxide reductase subunit C